MKVFRSFRIPKIFHNSVIAIGNFDGVHIGHQKVIKEAIRISKKKIKVGVLTFEPHPKCYFKKEFFFFRLSPFRIKYLLLKEMGIDFMLNIKFNSNLVNLKPKKFIEDILVKNLNVSHVVTGFDFVFGNNQSGNVKTMNSYSKETDDFLFTEVPEFRIKKSEISSSQIRNYLRNGKLRESNKMLSRNWQIISRVISGKKQARQLGFRTANMKINEYCNMSHGVYFVKVEVLNSNFKKTFKGVANYGVKPTFDKNEPLLEVHLFDFNENIYGKKLKVEFIKHIRKEKKFESIEKLKDQIIKDIKIIKNDRLF
jgi:riboflavin kinase/FMN adenylyltransferase